MLKTIAIIITTLAASLSLTNAEVQPFRVVLSESSSSFPSSYTVPAGKVLLVEAIELSATGSAPSSTQVRVSLRFDNASLGSFATFQPFNDFQNGIYRHLEHPIRLKASERLYVPNNATYLSARFICLLIDESDLYAANVETELTNPRVENGKLLADARFSSPRPKTLRIKSSPNLQNPTTDPSATVTAATATSATIAVDANTDKKFLSVQATTRPPKK